MSRIMLISDTHFGHRNICKYRPRFKDVAEHDTAVYEGIVSNIKKNDNLWILGDTVFNEDKLHYLESAKKYCASLNVVLGNHCTEGQRQQQMIRKLMDIADNVHTLTKKGDFWISHYPIHPDELRGRSCIHGHVHSKTVQDQRYINVCCENVDYKPISMQWIKDGWRGAGVPLGVIPPPIDYVDESEML